MNKQNGNKRRKRNTVWKSEGYNTLGAGRYEEEKRRILKKERQKQVRKRQIRRNILLAVSCICLILALEYVAVHFLGVGRETAMDNTVGITPISLEKAETVNADDLLRLIDQALDIDQAAYSVDSSIVLQQQMAEAQSVANHAESQDEIDNAYINLLIAIQGLKRID